MDKIIACGMTFMGCHGVLPQEKDHPQPFGVDLEMYLDLRPAGQQDDLNLTVNYAQVFAQVQKIVEEESYNLIEALAENIAASLLYRFPLTGVKVTVYKPQAPVQGKFKYFAVTIERFAN
jgi:dihydroneopterin aldolase